MGEGRPGAHVGSYRIERKGTQVLLRDVWRNLVFEGRLADSSGKWKVSAGFVITGSREGRNKNHAQSEHNLYRMLEDTHAREGAGRCYRGQQGGVCNASFVHYYVFPAFVSHFTLPSIISQYLLYPARFTLCIWLLVVCWTLLSLEELLLLYLFINHVHLSQGSTAETDLEAQC